MIRWPIPAFAAALALACAPAPTPAGVWSELVTATVASGDDSATAVLHYTHQQLVAVLIEVPNSTGTWSLSLKPTTDQNDVNVVAWSGLEENTTSYLSPANPSATASGSATTEVIYTPRYPLTATFQVTATQSSPKNVTAEIIYREY